MKTMRGPGRAAKLLAALAIGAVSLAACGDDDKEASAPEPDATVEMSEYAYAVSGELRSGGTLQVRNAGEEFHMMGMGKLKPGKTLADARKAIESESEDDDGEIYDEVGLPGNIMGPGEEAQLSMPDLDPGTYVMACFINVAGEETPHFLKGMTGELTVSSATAKAPEADATYTVSPGKAIKGPDELKAGFHVLTIEHDGDGKDLEPGFVALDEGATLEDFAKALKVFDEGPLPVDAASKLPGRFIVGAFDFEDQGSLSLGVDLDKGTYVLVAEDSDQDDKPDVPVEKIIITVT